MCKQETSRGVERPEKEVRHIPSGVEDGGLEEGGPIRANELVGRFDDREEVADLVEDPERAGRLEVLGDEVDDAVEIGAGGDVVRSEPIVVLDGKGGSGSEEDGNHIPMTLLCCGVERRLSAVVRCIHIHLLHPNKSGNHIPMTLPCCDV